MSVPLAQLVPYSTEKSANPTTQSLESTFVPTGMSRPSSIQMVKRSAPLSPPLMLPRIPLKQRASRVGEVLRALGVASVHSPRSYHQHPPHLHLSPLRPTCQPKCLTSALAIPITSVYALFSSQSKYPTTLPSLHIMSLVLNATSSYPGSIRFRPRFLGRPSKSSQVI